MGKKNSLTKEQKILKLIQKRVGEWNQVVWKAHEKLVTANNNLEQALSDGSDLIEFLYDDIQDILNADS